MMTKKALSGVLVSCVLSFFILPSVCSAKCVTPTNDLIITSDTELCPGKYNIDDTGADGVLIIQHSDITLDCKGSVLRGNGKGYAIYSHGFNKVIIRNCKISNYFAAIYLKQSSASEVSGNECESSRIGIALEDVTHSEIFENTLFNNNDGISLRRSSSNRISSNESCGSHECDIKIEPSSTGNAGDENECDKACKWSDTGTTGCTYACGACPDWDSDGICDSIDNCRFHSNPGQQDADGDGVGDACDNCVNTANPIDPVSGVQPDTDVDGLGNACDNCWASNNLTQIDSDNDCAALKANPAYWISGKWIKDPHCGDICDNCPKVSNADQLDTDGDNRGNVCDNCPTTSNWDQADDDGDGLGDLCDNCWRRANADQADRDKDGLGDACDCNDGFMGANEDGADCGGICPATCPNCIPIIENGHPSEKIDIVFVPDTDYGGNITQFLTDVMVLIQNGYFGATEFNSNRCKFNFYYYRQAGDYQPVCQKFDLPTNYSADCSFADSAAIIYTGGGRPCSGGVFSAPPGNTAAVVHETGHNIFGMKDEYCCDGGYSEPKAPHPNIFHSDANCKAMSETPKNCRNFCPEQRCDWPSNTACKIFAITNGFDPNACVGTCSPNWCNWRNTGLAACCVDGGDGWWKSDPDSCTMLNGTVFGPDCHERVSDKLASLPSCSSTRVGSQIPSDALARDEEPEVPKVIVIRFNIKGHEITALSSQIVYNHPPNYFLEDGGFLIRALSSLGEEFFSFVQKDPRDFFIFGDEENPPSRIVGDNVNFDVIVPFFPDVRIIEIRNYADGKLLKALDLDETVNAFCSDNPDDVDCQESAGLEGCATFNLLTSTMHIPCLDLHLERTYWVDFELRPDSWSISRYGENEPGAYETSRQCVTFDFLTGLLHIPCFMVRRDLVYWLDIILTAESWRIAGAGEL